MKPSELFDLPASLQGFVEHFKADVDVWEWIPAIAKALEAFDFETAPKREDIPHDLIVEGNVYIHPNAKLPPYGVIKGPVYIGAHCDLRPGVYIRGNVIVGEKCVLGNACEYKNCLLMDSVETPHYNYVGDSILGTGAHLAAGVILANLRLDRQPVCLKIKDERIQTSLKKMGAILGDFAQVGCNAVLQPGAILGKKAIVGPLTSFGGYLEAEGRAFK